MLKNILKLDGAQQLNKNAQIEIDGGKAAPPPCEVGCANLSSGAFCWASGTSPNCYCPGECNSSGMCIAY